MGKTSTLLTRVVALVALIFSASLAHAENQAWVGYDASSQTLTFHYDENKEQATGITTYNLPEKGSPSWLTYAQQIKTVVIDSAFDEVRPTSCAQWFFNMTNLSEIQGLKYLHTDAATTLAQMFWGCRSLASVDLSGFNTQCVTTMSGMFQNCSSLTQIDVSGFDTKNVTDMSSMFFGCSALTGLDLSHFDVTAVTTMNSMFSGCAALAEINLSSFKKVYATDMEMMFQGCSALTSLDMSRFSALAPQTLSCMFQNCTKLETLDLSRFRAANVTSVARMFNDCKSLSEIAVSQYFTLPTECDGTYMFSGCVKLKGYNEDEDGIEKAKYISDGGYFTERNVIKPWVEWNDTVGTLTFYYGDYVEQSSDYSLTRFDLPTDGKPKWSQYADKILKASFDSSFVDARPTSCSFWFVDCKKMTEIEGLENLNTSEVTSMYEMFYNCERLASLDLSHFNTANVTNMKGMFWSCECLKELDLSSFNTEKVTNMYEMFFYCRSLKSLDISHFNTANVTNMKGMFWSCECLKELDLSSFNTEKVTNMYEMFFYCRSLKSLDISHFNTANVTNMKGMFWSCECLKELDLSSFNTEKVTDMLQMFYNCEQLETLDLKNFNTANVTDMTNMFGDCCALTSLDLSSFNTSNVTDMSAMFESCNVLTSLDLSSFNTSNVTDMSEMFRYCEALTSLNLSSFNTSKVRTFKDMFEYSGALKYIYVSDDFVIPEYTYGSDMFYRCTSLPNFDSNNVDEEMANYKTGYFRLFEPWVAYNAETKTLSFHCDGKRMTTETTATYAIPTTSVKDPAWLEYKTDIETVVIDSSFVYAHLVDCQSWFREMTNLKNIQGLEYLNTSEVTNMSNMFYHCSSLTDLDIEYLQTANVTDMSRMFSYCSQLAVIDVSSFETEKVTDMSSMFYGCSAVKSIYACNSFVVPTTCTGTNMFYGCAGLEGYSDSKVDTTYAKYTTLGGYFTHISEEPEAWVLFDEATGTLSFRYDKKRLVAQTTNKYLLTDVDENTVDIEDSSMVAPAWHTHAKDVLRVEFAKRFSDVRPTTCSFWFHGMNRLKSIKGMEYLNTSETTAMAWMFVGCDSLSEISRTLTNLSTAKVTNMKGMFAECQLLTDLDLTSFNTENVTTMADMFNGCLSLKSVDVSRFNTAKVTDMSNMFFNCNALETLNLSSFNTSNVANTSGMFGYCSSLTTLDLSNFNMAKDTTMSRMFRSCSALTELDLSSLKTTAVKDMSNMFTGCSSLTTLDLSSFVPSSAETTRGMFGQCDKLNIIYVSDRFVIPESCEDTNMFVGCGALPNFDSKQVGKQKAIYTTLGGYLTASAVQPWAEYDATQRMLTFYNNNMKKASFCKAYDLNEGNNPPGWYDKRYEVVRVVFDDSFAEARPTSCASWFENMNGGLTSIDGLENLNTSCVTTMYRMFYSIGLNSIDLSHLNTSNVTNMEEMFMWSNKLITLDLTSFNTSNVTTMRQMFASCYALTSIDLSSFNTSKVTDMYHMFDYCKALLSLDLTSFDTKNVTDMSQMFGTCCKLHTLDLSSFNTASLQQCPYMFEKGSFSDETNLSTIYASDLFQIPNGCNAYAMFNGCDSLPGFVRDSVGKEKAMDTSKGGYFTLRRLFYVGNTHYPVDGTEAICYKDVPFTDGEAYSSRFDFSFDAENTASYTRKVSNHWATLCLPFAFNADDSEDKFYAVSQYDEDKISVSRLTGDIDAGTPVLVYTNGNTISISAKGAAAVANPVENDVLVGAFAQTEVENDDYIIANDHFWNVAWLKEQKGAEHVYVAPYRAYLKLAFSESSKPNSISIAEGETTGVQSIDVADTSDNIFDGAELYDIQGRRLSAPTRGIVIVRKNGVSRKVVVK